MGGVRDYRDLLVWQRAMDLLVVAHAICRELSPDDRGGFGDEIRRSAASVAANIAEGNGRSRRREYIRFLTISNGSLRALETYVEAGRRLGLIDGRRAADATVIALETRMLLLKMRAALARGT